MKKLFVFLCFVYGFCCIYSQDFENQIPDIGVIEEEFNELYPRWSFAYRLFGEMRVDLRYLDPFLYCYELTQSRQYIDFVYYNNQINSISNNILTIHLDTSFESSNQMTIAYHRFEDDEEHYQLIPIFVFNIPSGDDDGINLEIIHTSTETVLQVPFYGNSSSGLYIYRGEFQLPLSELAETTQFIFHINGESFPVELNEEARDMVLNYEFEEIME